MTETRADGGGVEVEVVETQTIVFTQSQKSGRCGAENAGNHRTPTQTSIVTTTTRIAVHCWQLQLVALLACALHARQLQHRTWRRGQAGVRGGAVGAWVGAGGMDAMMGRPPGSGASAIPSAEVTADAMAALRRGRLHPAGADIFMD